MEVDATRVAKGQWWDRALSLVEGCTPCAPECRECWSAAATHMRKDNPTPKTAARYRGLTNDAGKFNGTVRFMEADLDKPLRTHKPTVWSVWNDLFHEKVTKQEITSAFCVMAAAPEHSFLVLTKRPNRMQEFIESKPRLRDAPLPNVALGTTVGHPDSLWRIGELLKCQASMHFLSLEPLLGELDLTDYLSTNCIWKATRHHELTGHAVQNSRHMDSGEYTSRCLSCNRRFVDGKVLLDWVIVGPETGPNRRPCDPEHIHSLIDQADAAGVPVFVKAFPINGKVSKNMTEWPEWARRREFPEWR